MHYISRILIVLAIFVFAQNANAQPPTRRGDNKTEKKENAISITLTERAKSQYPGLAVPEEVDWKRDIYRSINLEVEDNATLYYPVEPMDGRVNLFTLLFRLVLSGDITAYKYNLDGYESFTDENKMEPKTMLENYLIYYEESNNGELVVGNSDVPSAEVLSYYVKENHYYDQKKGTYGKHITAICPVLHRTGDLAEVTKYPMFWVSYNEIKPFLTQNKIMASSLNNVAQTTFDDFFARGLYKGDIYKTVNAKNLAISQYCKDSTEIKKEQEKIEQQLKDFETNLWNTKSVAEIRKDSINAAKEAANDTIKVEEKKEKKIVKSNSARPTVQKTEKSKTPKSNISKPKQKAPSRPASGTVSVRRTRR